VFDCCFRGDFLFSTSYDRTARCWDFDTGACVRVFRGHRHGILPIVFIPSESDTGQGDDLEQETEIYAKDMIITGSQDNTAKTWSFETGDCLKTFRGHTGAILALTTDPLGKILFTGSADNTIRAWDLYRGAELRSFDQHQAAVINLTVRHESMSATMMINIDFVDRF
jgi:WD repeat-containing protein 86